LSEKESPPTVSNSTFKTDFGPAGAAGGEGGEGFGAQAVGFLVRGTWPRGDDLLAGKNSSNRSLRQWMSHP
jgi:hypothetical protein